MLTLCYLLKKRGKMKKIVIDMFDFAGELDHQFPKGDPARGRALVLYSIGKILIDETKVAFGGCTKCYGKGYSTMLCGYRSTTDFGALKTDKWMKEEVRFCDCERGKSLEVLWQKRG